MGKAAAKKITTTDANGDDTIKRASELLAASAAKQQFVFSTMNLGWRLAITVVVPIVGGVKIDEHFHTAPSWTLVGLMLAVFAGSAAVWATIKEVNKEQAENEKATAEKPVKKRKENE